MTLPRFQAEDFANGCFGLPQRWPDKFERAVLASKGFGDAYVLSGGVLVAKRRAATRRQRFEWLF